MPAFNHRYRATIYRSLMRALFYASILLITPLCIATKLSASQPIMPPIRIVGSSTVFPFMALLAEHAAQSNSTDTVPIVEATGTGAGLRLLCSPSNNEYLIAAASRPISKAEKKLCQKNFQTDVYQYVLGLDGLVLIAPENLPTFSVSRQDLYKALAAYVPSLENPKKFVKNFYKNWCEINKDLPRLPIRVYGPPSNAGLFEALIHLVFSSQCTPKKNHQFCKDIRRDGTYVEMPENSTLMLEKLSQDPGAIGLASYRLFDQNRNRFQALAIEGIAPTPQTIRSKTYPLARELYIYTRHDQHKTKPLENFFQHLKKPSFTKNGGKFETLGLITKDADFTTL